MPDNWNIEFLQSVYLGGDYHDVAVYNEEIAYFSTGHGIAVADVSNPEEPGLIDHIPTPGTANEIALVGDNIYLCDGYNGLLVYDISENPLIPEQIKHMPEIPAASKIVVADNFACIYQRRYRNMYILEINDPSDPELVNVTEIDVPICLVSIDDLLYILTESRRPTAIWSINNPANPELLREIPSNEMSGVGCIDTERSIFYSSFTGVYSLRNRLSPQLIGNMSDDGHNTVIFGNYVLMLDDYFFRIEDVANPTRPRFLGIFDPGWRDHRLLTTPAIEFYNNFAFSPNNGIGFSILDFSDPEDPSIIGEYDDRGSALGIVKKDDYAIIFDRYYREEQRRYQNLIMRVFSLEDPLNPEEVAVYNDFNIWGGRVCQQDNWLYVLYSSSYIQIFDITNPEEIQAVASIPRINNNYMISDYVVKDDLIYMVGRCLWVISIEDVDNPEMIFSLRHHNPPFGDRSVYVMLHEDHLYVYDEYAGLRIYSLDNPEEPELVNVIPKGDLRGFYHGVFYEDYFYSPRGRGGVSIIDISNPSEAFIVRYFHQNVSGGVNSLFVENGLLYLGNKIYGMYAYSLEEPNNPIPVGCLDTPGYVCGIIQHENYLYLADDHEFGIYDIDALSLGQQLSPSEHVHDFWDIFVDSTSSWTLTITNLDDSPHEVTNIRLESDVFNCPFDDAIELDPGDEVSFEVTFTPTEEMFYSDHLYVVSGDNEIDIPLRGRGISIWEDDGNGVGSRIAVGTTWYDSQSNCNTGRMISLDENSDVHLAWIKGFEPEPGGERHVFYNYLVDNESQFAIGTQIDHSPRAGFPNVCFNSETGIIPVFHIDNERDQFTSCIGTDEENGAGNFTTIEIPNGDEHEFGWPHSTIDRRGRVHVFSRRHEADRPWNLVQYRRCELTDDDEWNFSEQEIAAHVVSISYATTSSPASDKVALAYFRPVYAADNWDYFREGWYGQANNDLFVVESEDGENFDWDNPTNITRFMRPNPEVDPESPIYQGDTLRCYSFLDACYDSEDNLHVIFSTVGFREPVVEDDEFSGHSAQNLIWHWDRESDEIHLVVDAWYPYGGYLSDWQSNVSYPTIAAADDGKLYCVFTAFLSNGERAANNFVNGEIFGTVSINGGQNWARSTNLSNTHAAGSRPGSGMSESWCSLAETVDDNLHISYILDRDPGAISQGEGTATNNPVIYHRVPRNEIAEEPIIRDRQLHIEGGDLPLLTVSLQPGWNLISINVSPPDHFWEREDGPDIILMTDQLRVGENSHHIILMKDEDGHFYSPRFNFNNISCWNLTEGYQINIDEEIETIWRGERVASDADIPLEAGWNFIAYYPRFELDASAPDFYVISPIIDHVIIAKDGNGNFMLPEFDFSNMPSWRESQGYQVRIDEDVVLNYPPAQDEIRDVGYVKETSGVRRPRLTQFTPPCPPLETRGGK